LRSSIFIQAAGSYRDSEETHSPEIPQRPPQLAASLSAGEDWRQAREGGEPVAGFLQAVGDRACSNSAASIQASVFRPRMVAAHDPQYEVATKLRIYRRSPHRARPRAKSCIRLPGSRPSGLIPVSEQFCTDTESTHAIFVVWCTERIIKLTRAMTLQLSRGGITRAGLPRPSQTKRRESIEEWALPSGEAGCRPL
jgi:hypothetical protein